MGLFVKSFGEKVQEAVAVLGKSGFGVRDLRATVEGKVVTLDGRADGLDAKGRIMTEFNKLVDTENTINRHRGRGSPAVRNLRHGHRQSPPVLRRNPDGRELRRDRDLPLPGGRMQLALRPMPEQPVHGRKGFRPPRPGAGPFLLIL